MDSIIDEKITLIDLLDPGILQEVCDSFSVCFSLGLFVISDQGEEILTSCPDHAFCKAVHKSPLQAKCEDVRKKLYKYPLEGSRVFQTKAFCGLRYAIFPLTHEFETLGRVVVGPFLDPDQDDKGVLKALGEDAAKHKIPVELARKTPAFTQDRLKVAIRLLVKFLDAFLFINVKRLITTRLHLENIYADRAAIFRQVELQDSGTKEDKEEIEKLRNMF